MRVAVLGTGLMGAPMALRLAEAGHEVFAYNRTRSRAEPLSESGVVVTESAAEALSEAECAITMLADGPATAALLLNPESREALPGTTVIQMGTIGPWESEELADQVRASGGEYFEAPVLGSIAQVEAGELLVMIGATSEEYEEWQDLLAVFGPAPRLVGGVGQAAALKLALNHMIAALTAAFSLSLGIVRREDISIEAFMDILRDSAIYAPTFDKKLPRMLERDFSDPNFPVHLLQKDIDLVQTEAERLQLGTAALEGLRQVIAEALEGGWVDVDYSAIYNALDPAE